jgi:hypothetical protein
MFSLDSVDENGLSHPQGLYCQISDEVVQANQNQFNKLFEPRMDAQNSFIDHESEVSHQLVIEKSHTANKVVCSESTYQKRLEVSIVRSPRSTTFKPDQLHASMLERAAGRMMAQEN